VPRRNGAFDVKVAYVFVSPRAASYKLGQMILPQLEAGTHGVEVAGMFFFDDNVFVLRRGDPIGERLSRVAQQKKMLVRMCDMCALERGLAEGAPRWCDAQGRGRTEPGECRVKDTVAGVTVGCFPDLYTALAGNMPDQVISL
jgi:hypothetical protein